MSDAYDKVQFRGHTVNKRTRAMVWEAEKLLGKGRRFEVLQGSYNKGVDASAQTHWGGGVVDLYLSPDGNVHGSYCCRRVGFASWPRTPDQGFSYHIHAVAIGDRQLSPGPYGAAVQVDDFFHGGDGLAGDTPDRYKYRPDPPVVFDYPSWVAKNRLRRTLRVLAERVRHLRARRAQAKRQLEKLS